MEGGQGSVQEAITKPVKVELRRNVMRKRKRRKKRREN
jgi:hypothetical protein